MRLFQVTKKVDKMGKKWSLGFAFFSDGNFTKYHSFFSKKEKVFCTLLQIIITGFNL